MRGVVVLACAAEFMVVLDVSVVNVALPALSAELGTGPAGAAWVVNAYALVFAGFLLLGGRLADVVGHRGAFAVGLAVFSAIVGDQLMRVPCRVTLLPLASVIE